MYDVCIYKKKQFKCLLDFVKIREIKYINSEKSIKVVNFFFERCDSTCCFFSIHVTKHFTLTQNIMRFT